MSMKIVSTHSGSAYVKGKARRYSYWVASVFETKNLKNGKTVFVNTGIHTHPRRSITLCVEDGRELAKENNCSFIDKRRSLHMKSYL